MTATRAKREPGTPERILDIAERLVQVRGFGNVSYADVARELEITTASLHYHFPGKAELGQALIARYSARFFAALEQIDGQPGDALTKLESYTRLYADVLRDHRMCLCGILAAEYQTLPEPMRDAVIRFFDGNQEWLEAVLEQGRQDQTLTITESTEEIARSIISTLEGAMLVARPYDDLAIFNSTARRLLASLAR
jgi:TetR/AcrR family transcriptional repressor of nem operon